MLSFDKLTNFKINSCLFITPILPSCLLITCTVFVTSPKLLAYRNVGDRVLTEHGIAWYLKLILVGGLEPEACIPKNNNNKLHKAG